VIMIIDPNGIAKALGTSVEASHEIADENAAMRANAAEQLTSLLGISAPAPRSPRQCRLALADPAGRNRRRQDRTLERPLYGAITAIS